MSAHRWRLVVRTLFVATFGLIAMSTTTAGAAGYAYDASVVARVDANVRIAIPRASVRVAGPREGPAVPQAAGPGASTTRNPSVVATNTPSGATNRAAHEAYTDRLRAAMERPHVVNSELSGLMDDLYRPGSAKRQRLSTTSIGSK